MLNENNLHQYQKHCVEHLIEFPQSALFLEMGLGKTISTLTAINELLYNRFEVSKVLVIAPKRVAEHTWLTEAAKWEHTKHLRLSLVLGTERQRKEALRAKADIFITNRENVAWLVSQYGTAFPFDMVVIDELSSFKSAKSVRFKALRMIRSKVNRIVGLTGTPAPNSLLDLWPQLYLLDQGERLGKSLTKYRERYFNPGKRNGHVVYDYKLDGQKDDGIIGAGVYEKEIYEKVGDICISMKAKDWLELPERINRTIEILMPARVKEQYDEFEKSQVLALEDEDEISVPNAAALSNKLLQFANGAVYNENKNWHEIHRLKLEALEEIMENANGHPVLVFYTYKSDLARIQKHLKEYKPRVLETSQDIDDWNAKKIQMMCCHPASAGHGLNLQAGGNLIVWFGNTWSLELFQQANARLDRQGQVESVIVHSLVALGTMDEDVIKALAGKAKGQDALMDAVKARIKKYKSN